MPNGYVFQDWQLRQAGEAVRKALEEAGDVGIPKEQVLTLIKTTLGTQVAPMGSALGILCRYGRVRNWLGTYYLVGKGPRDEKKVKEATAKPTVRDETYEFENVDVAVNGKNVKFSASKVKKVTIVVSTLLIVVIPLGAHLLGFI